ACSRLTVPAPPATYPLPLHDALPILVRQGQQPCRYCQPGREQAALDQYQPGQCRQETEEQRNCQRLAAQGRVAQVVEATVEAQRSEEHTSELQSRENLVCRLLLDQQK